MDIGRPCITTSLSDSVSRVFRLNLVYGPLYRMLRFLRRLAVKKTLRLGIICGENLMSFSGKIAPAKC